MRPQILKPTKVTGDDNSKKSYKEKLEELTRRMKEEAVLKFRGPDHPGPDEDIPKEYLAKDFVTAAIKDKKKAIEERRFEISELLAEKDYVAAGGTNIIAGLGPAVPQRTIESQVNRNRIVELEDEIVKLELDTDIGFQKKLAEDINLFLKQQTKTGRPTTTKNREEFLDGLKNKGYTYDQIRYARDEFQFTKDRPNIKKAQLWYQRMNPERHQEMVETQARAYAGSYLFDEDEKKASGILFDIKSKQKELKSVEEEKKVKVKTDIKKLRQKLDALNLNTSWLDPETGKTKEDPNDSEELALYKINVNRFVEELLRDETTPEKIERMAQERFQTYQYMQQETDKLYKEIYPFMTDPKVIDPDIKTTAVKGFAAQAELMEIMKEKDDAKAKYEAAARLAYLNEDPGERTQTWYGKKAELLGRGFAAHFEFPITALSKRQPKTVINEAMLDLNMQEGLPFTDQDVKNISQTISDQITYGTGGVLGIALEFMLLDRALAFARVPQGIQAIKGLSAFRTATISKEAAKAYRARKLLQLAKEGRKATVKVTKMLDRNTKIIENLYKIRGIGKPVGYATQLAVEGVKFEAVGGDFTTGVLFPIVGAIPATIMRTVGRGGKVVLNTSKFAKAPLEEQAALFLNRSAVQRAGSKLWQLPKTSLQLTTTTNIIEAGRIFQDNIMHSEFIAPELHEMFGTNEAMKRLFIEFSQNLAFGIRSMNNPEDVTMFHKRMENLRSFFIFIKDPHMANLVSTYLKEADISTLKGRRKFVEDYTKFQDYANEIVEGIIKKEQGEKPEQPLNVYLLPEAKSEESKKQVIEQMEEVITTEMEQEKPNLGTISELRSKIQSLKHIKEPPKEQKKPASQQQLVKNAEVLGFKHEVPGGRKPFSQTMITAGVSFYEGEAKKVKLGDVLDVKYTTKEQAAKEGIDLGENLQGKPYNHWLNIERLGETVGSIKYMHVEDNFIRKLINEGKEVRFLITGTKPMTFEVISKIDRYSKRYEKAGVGPVKQEALVEWTNILDNKFGVKTDIINDPTKKYAGRINPKTGRPELNLAYASLQDPLHEHSHPFLAHLAQTNKPAFDNIHKTLKSKFADLYEKVSARMDEQYQELDKNNLTANEEELSIAMGIASEEIKNNGKNAKRWKQWLDKLFELFRKMIGKIRGKRVAPEDLTEQTTFDDVLKMFMDEGTKVTYDPKYVMDIEGDVKPVEKPKTADITPKVSVKKTTYTAIDANMAMLLLPPATISHALQLPRGVLDWYRVPSGEYRPKKKTFKTAIDLIESIEAESGVPYEYSWTEKTKELGEVVKTSVTPPHMITVGKKDIPKDIEKHIDRISISGKFGDFLIKMGDRKINISQDFSVKELGYNHPESQAIREFQKVLVGENPGVKSMPANIIAQQYINFLNEYYGIGFIDVGGRNTGYGLSGLLTNNATSSNFRRVLMVDDQLVNAVFNANQSAHLYSTKQEDIHEEFSGYGWASVSLINGRHPLLSEAQSDFLRDVEMEFMKHGYAYYKTAGGKANKNRVRNMVNNFRGEMKRKILHHIETELFKRGDQPLLHNDLNYQLRSLITFEEQPEDTKSFLPLLNVKYHDLTPDIDLYWKISNDKKVLAHVKETVIRRISSLYDAHIEVTKDKIKSVKLNKLDLEVRYYVTRPLIDAFMVKVDDAFKQDAVKLIEDVCKEAAGEMEKPKPTDVSAAALIGITADEFTKLRYYRVNPGKLIDRVIAGKFGNLYSDYARAKIKKYIIDHPDQRNSLGSELTNLIQHCPGIYNNEFGIIGNRFLTGNKQQVAAFNNSNSYFHTLKKSFDERLDSHEKKIRQLRNKRKFFRDWSNVSMAVKYYDRSYQRKLKVIPAEGFLMNAVCDALGSFDPTDPAPTQLVDVLQQDPKLKNYIDFSKKFYSMLLQRVFMEHKLAGYKEIYMPTQAAAYQIQNNKNAARLYAHPDEQKMPEGSSVISNYFTKNIDGFLNYLESVNKLDHYNEWVLQTDQRVNAPYVSNALEYFSKELSFEQQADILKLADGVPKTIPGVIYVATKKLKVATNVVAIPWSTSPLVRVDLTTFNFKGWERFSKIPPEELPEDQNKQALPNEHTLGKRPIDKIRQRLTGSVLPKEFMEADKDNREAILAISDKVSAAGYTDDANEHLQVLKDVFKPNKYKIYYEDLIDKMRQEIIEYAGLSEEVKTQDIEEDTEVEQTEETTGGFSMSREQKWNSLSSKFRSITEELRKRGSLDPTMDLYKFVSTPGLYNATVNQEAFWTFMETYDGEMNDVADVIVSDETLTFSNLVSLINFYHSNHPLKSITYLKGFKGPYMATNVNQADMVESYTKIIKRHLESFTYGDYVSTNKALQMFYLSRMKTPGSELRTIQTQVTDPKERKTLLHQFYLEFLSDVTSLSPEVWKYYFMPPKNSKHEIAYLSGSEETPNIIKYIGRKFSEPNTALAIFDYFIETPKTGISQSNIIKLINLLAGEHDIKSAFYGIMGKRKVSFEQSSDLILRSKEIAKMITSEFYKGNKIVEKYTEQGNIPIKKIEGYANNITSKQAEFIDAAESEVIRNWLIEFAGDETEYLHWLGQFGDKNQGYHIVVDKIDDYKQIYQQMYRKETNMIAPENILTDETVRYFSSIIASGGDAFKKYRSGEDRQKFIEAFLYNFAINATYAQQIFFGDVGDYKTLPKLVSRAGSSNSPGFAPNTVIQGGVGKTRNIIIIPDMIGGKDFEITDGNYLITKSWLGKLSVSVGDIFAQPDKFASIFANKAVHSQLVNTDTGPRRYLQKGNGIELDFMAEQYPESAYGKLFKYIGKWSKKLGVPIDQIVFETCVKLNPYEVTPLIKDNKVDMGVKPTVATLDNDYYLVQLDQRRKPIPKMSKLPEQFRANSMWYKPGEGDYNVADEINLMYINKQLNDADKFMGDLNHTKSRAMLLKSINKEDNPDVYDYILNGGSEHNPYYQTLLQNIKSSVINRNTMRRKTNRVILIDVSPVDINLKPYRKITLKDGRQVMLLPERDADVSGVRYRSKPFRDYNKAILYASKFPDLKDKKGKLKEWFIKQEGKDFYVPGEYGMASRLPSVPHSHSMFRYRNRVSGGADVNVMFFPWQHAQVIGSDNDGDDHKVDVLVKKKNEEGQWIQDEENITNKTLDIMARAAENPENEFMFGFIMDPGKYSNTVKNLRKGQELPFNSLQANLKLRKDAVAGRKTIGIIANSGTTFDYIRKLGLPMKGSDINFPVMSSESSADILGTTPLEGFIEDRYGIVKANISTLFNVVLDNIKNPTAFEMGITPSTAKLVTLLLVINKKLDESKTPEKYEENVLKWIDNIATYFNQPLLQEYMHLSDESFDTFKGYAPSLEVYAALRRKFPHKIKDIEILRRLNYIAADMKLLFSIIKATREMPKTTAEVYTIEAAIEKFLFNRMRNINTSPGIVQGVLNDHLRMAQEAVRLARQISFKDSIDMSDMAGKLINIMELTKGAKKKGPIVLNDILTLLREFKTLSILQAFDSGMTFNEVEQQVIENVNKKRDNAFYQLLTTGIEGFEKEKEYVQILPNYTKATIPQNNKKLAWEAFDKLPKDEQDMLFVYSVQKYGMRNTTWDKNFSILFGPQFMRRLGGISERLGKEWNSEDIDPQQMDKFYHQLIRHNKNLDFVGEYDHNDPINRYYPLSYERSLATELKKAGDVAVWLKKNPYRHMEDVLKSRPMDLKTYESWREIALKDPKYKKFSDYLIYLSERKDTFYERLRRLKLDEDVLYGGFAGIPAATINGLIESIIALHKGGTLVSDAINKVLNEFSLTEEFKTKQKNGEITIEALKRWIKKEHDWAMMAPHMGAGRNGYMFLDSRDAMREIQKRFGGRRSNFGMVEWMDATLYHGWVDDYLEKKLHFSKTEIEVLSLSEKLAYYCTGKQKGTIPVDVVETDPSDKEQTERFTSPVSPEEHHSRWGTQYDLTDPIPGIVAPEDMDPADRDLALKYVHADSESYRQYIDAVHTVRNQILRIKNVNFNRPTKHDIDLLFVIKQKIEPLDELAKEELMYFLDQYLASHMLKEMVEYEFTDPHPDMPNNFARAVRDLIFIKEDKLEIKDMKLRLGKAGIIFVHHHEIDYDYPLLQLATQVAREKDIKYNIEVGKVTTVLSDFSRVLGSADKGLKRFKLVSQYDTRIRSYINPLLINMQERFPEVDSKKDILLMRKMRNEYMDKNGNPNKYKDILQPKNRKHAEELLKYFEFYTWYRRFLLEFSPKHAEANARGHDMMLPVPNVYKKVGEIFNVGEQIASMIVPSKRREKQIYNWFAPNPLDSVFIDKAGTTYQQAKLALFKQFKTDGNINILYNKMKDLVDVAKRVEKAGGGIPDVTKVRKGTMRIPSGGITNTLPEEFQTEDDFYAISKYTEAILTRYFRREIEPLLKVIGKMYEPYDIANEYLTKWLAYDVYGISPDPYSGTFLQKAVISVALFTSAVVLGGKTKAMLGNFIPGMATNTVFMSDKTALGAAAILRWMKEEPLLFLKVRNIMHKNQIANVTKELHITGMDRIYEEASNVAFFTMEASEMAVQMAPFVGSVGAKRLIEAYNQDGTPKIITKKDTDENSPTYGKMIKLTHPLALSPSEMLFEKTNLGVHHGFYGNARALYGKIALWAAGTHFYGPWSYSQFMLWFRMRAKTDMFGTFHIGVLRAIYEDLYRLSRYNYSTPAMRERTYQRIKDQVDKGQDVRSLVMWQRLIYDYEGEKVDKKMVPKQIRTESWGRKLAAASAISFIGYLGYQMFKDLEEDLNNWYYNEQTGEWEKQKKIEEISKQDRLKMWFYHVMADLSRDLMLNVIIPFDMFNFAGKAMDISHFQDDGFFIERAAKPFAHVLFYERVGKLLRDLLWLERYDRAGPDYKRGELKIIKDLLKLVPVIGTIYLDARKLHRTTVGIPQWENEEARRIREAENTMIPTIVKEALLRGMTPNEVSRMIHSGAENNPILEQIIDATYHEWDLDDMLPSFKDLYLQEEKIPVTTEDSIQILIKDFVHERKKYIKDPVLLKKTDIYIEKEIEKKNKKPWN